MTKREASIRIYNALGASRYRDDLFRWSRATQDMRDRYISAFLECGEIVLMGIRITQ